MASHRQKYLAWHDERRRREQLSELSASTAGWIAALDLPGMLEIAQAQLRLPPEQREESPHELAAREQAEQAAAARGDQVFGADGFFE